MTETGPQGTYPHSRLESASMVLNGTLESLVQIRPGLPLARKYAAESLPSGFMDGKEKKCQSRAGVVPATTRPSALRPMKIFGVFARAGSAAQQHSRTRPHNRDKRIMVLLLGPGWSASGRPLQRCLFPPGGLQGKN